MSAIVSLIIDSHLKAKSSCCPNYFSAHTSTNSTSSSRIFVSPRGHPAAKRSRRENTHTVVSKKRTTVAVREHIRELLCLEKQRREAFAVRAVTFEIRGFGIQQSKILHPFLGIQNPFLGIQNPSLRIWNPFLGIRNSAKI